MRNRTGNLSLNLAGNLQYSKHVSLPPMIWPPETSGFTDFLVSLVLHRQLRFLNDVEHYRRFAMSSILRNSDRGGSYNNGDW